MAKRKMTEQQRQAAIERLAKARAAKAPAQYKNIHQSVLDLDPDHWRSMHKVKEWIKNAKSRAQTEHQSHRMGDKGALSRVMTWKAYANDLDNYLKTGDYTSDFSGMNMESRVQRRCVAMAYYPNGKPKRDIGTWYPDVCATWTPDMENDEREQFGMERLQYTPEGHILVEREEAPKLTKTGKKKREMTPEQKAALVERLAKARAAKKNNK